MRQVLPANIRRCFTTIAGIADAWPLGRCWGTICINSPRVRRYPSWELQRLASNTRSKDSITPQSQKFRAYYRETYSLLMLE